MGIVDRLLGLSETDPERDNWWLRTDGVAEPPPPDYDVAAEERARNEADERDVPLDPRAGYHRYDGEPDFEDGAPIYNDEPEPDSEYEDE